MADVCPGEILTNITFTRIIQGSKITLISRIFYCQYTVFGKDHSVRTVTRRQYTIKQIDSSFNTFQQILGSSNPHEITGSICRKNIRTYLRHLVHLLCRLSDGKSSDSISIKIKLHYSLRTLFSFLRKNASLDNSEKRLCITVHLYGFFESPFTSFSPLDCTFLSLLDVSKVAGIGYTFVQNHHNIRSQNALYIDNTLR